MTSPQPEPDETVFDLGPEDMPPYVEGALIEEDRMINQLFGEHQ